MGIKAERRDALEWVDAGALWGWDRLRNDDGYLIPPPGYWTLWDAGLTRHDDIGWLRLTPAGQRELRSIRSAST
jgi:hypothetical protein